ncbi:hypothetical protein MIND_01386800 [Mycena indigotica]|uniref:Uncharacterized protein n=1 Tax=Mycena indigotica TaxID=2126181 RepID=A0A8H6RYY5_9AGAR|nr:uncharacterized protein MIND_01386800 [Mycena indigotica]KAF7289253.1 hypothetical protein MIND_01386800 [Mycena indigotica]
MNPKPFSRQPSASRHSPSRHPPPSLFRLFLIALRLALAQKYDILAWRAAALAVRELAFRAQPLSVEEGKKIGVDTVLAIEAVKHEVLANMAQYMDEGKVGELVAREVARMKD